jgi:hypothetical protein
MFRPNWTAVGGEESTPFPLTGVCMKCLNSNTTLGSTWTWDLLTKGIIPEICLHTLSHGVLHFKVFETTGKKNRSRMWCPHEILEFKHNFGFHLKVVSPWCSAREWVTWRDRGVSMRLGDSLRPWVTERGHQVIILNTWIPPIGIGSIYTLKAQTIVVHLIHMISLLNGDFDIIIINQPTITNHSMVINPSPWYWTPPTNPGLVGDLHSFGTLGWGVQYWDGRWD